MAPQFTRMKGPRPCRTRLWMARAMTSLPEPVSPRDSTGTSEGLTKRPAPSRSQPAVGADDRVAHLGAPQPPEERLLFGFGRLTQSGISCSRGRSSSAAANGSKMAWSRRWCCGVKD